MQCPFCHQEHPDNVLFCPITGQSLKQGPHTVETFPLAKPSPLIFWGFLALMLFGLGCMAGGAILTFNQLSPTFFSRSSEIPNGAELVGRIEKTGVSILAHAPDGQRLAIALTQDIFVYQTPSFLQRFHAQTSAPVTALVFSWNSQHLAAALENGGIAIFQVSEGSMVSTLTTNTPEVEQLTFSPDAQRLAGRMKNGAIWVWDWLNATSTLNLNTFSGKLSDLAFSPDGKWLAACDDAGYIYLWDPLTGNLVQTIFTSTFSLSRLAFSPNSQALALVAPQAIQIWEVPEGHLLKTIHAPTEGMSGDHLRNYLAYSADGLYLICGCAGSLMILRVADGVMVAQVVIEGQQFADLIVLPEGQITLPAVGTSQINLFAWELQTVLANALVSTPASLAQVTAPVILPSPTATPPSPTPPSATNTLTPTATFTQAPTATPTLTATSAATNPVDGAVLIVIPAGEFIMGSDPKEDPYFWGAEGPPHSVYLDEYWIYRTEVTNGMYQKCVTEKKCPLPMWPRSATRDEYYSNPQYVNYPVIFVSYVHAQAYCRWAGAALPTEAQWEKAARGSDGRLFPWGNTPPTSGQINFQNQDTAEVGTFPEDMSPYGVMDMAGNVWEWVFDYFQETFYSVSPDENPRGPVSGTRRVIRGGAFFGNAGAVRTVMRASYKPDETFEAVGFRCAVQTLP